MFKYVNLKQKKEKKMKFNCLLAGVGGQGTVLASKMIAQVAIEQGEFVRTSETIGMAQRGGTVVSHVRIGSSTMGPCIPKHKADLLIGFEPAEALRNIDILKENGIVLVSVDPIIPVTASLGNNKYDVAEILAVLENRSGKIIKIEGKKMCQELGNLKVFNIMMLGLAVGADLLPFSEDAVRETLKNNLPSGFKELNDEAFTKGLIFGRRSVS